jgi:Trypsin-co-occurring domain 2
MICRLITDFRPMPAGFRSISLPVLVLAAMATPVWSNAQAQDEATLSAVIEALKSEIAEAQEDRSDQGLLLKIERAVISLQLVSSSNSETGAGLTFTVAGLDFAAKAAADATHEQSTLLVLEFALDDDVLVSSKRELGLAAAIRQLKDAVRVAMDAKPVMTLQKAEVDLNFLVQRTSNGKLNFVVISGEEGRTRKTAHRIQLFLTMADF